MPLQRDAPLPLSQQLAGLLRAQIESGERAPGSRLPTIMQLSQEHGVATATVVKALRILKREGLVIGSSGRSLLRQGRAARHSAASRSHRSR
jgi:DNA-binding GntR family transcriptional regulator